MSDSITIPKPETELYHLALDECIGLTIRDVHVEEDHGEVQIILKFDEGYSKVGVTGNYDEDNAVDYENQAFSDTPCQLMVDAGLIEELAFSTYTMLVTAQNEAQNEERQLATRKARYLELKAEFEAQGVEQ